MTLEELQKTLKEKGFTAVLYPCVPGCEPTTLICDKADMYEIVELLGMPLDKRLAFS